jgi:hypothetical protein
VLLWTPGSPPAQPIAVPGSSFHPAGIDDRGRVVGTAIVDGTTTPRVATWAGPGQPAEILDQRPEGESRGIAANGKGDVLGLVVEPDGRHVLRIWSAPATES